MTIDAAGQPAQQEWRCQAGGGQGGRHRDYESSRGVEATEFIIRAVKNLALDN